MPKTSRRAFSKSVEIAPPSSGNPSMGCGDESMVPRAVETAWEMTRGLDMVEKGEEWF